MRINKQHPRPKRVTITLWCVFLLGVWNVGKVVAFYVRNRLLLTLEITPGPRILLAGAFIWAILFWGLGGALWRKRPFTHKTIPVTLTIYLLYEFSLLLFFAQQPSSSSTWFIRIIISFFAVWFFYVSLNRSTKREI